MSHDDQFEKAQAYAWGRQDTGDDPYDSDRAREFARAYMLRAVEFAQERGHSLPNLRAAYEEWRRTGAITGGLHAPTQRRLPMPSSDALNEMGAATWLTSLPNRPPCTFVELDDRTQQLWRNVAQAALQEYTAGIGALLESSERAS